MQGALEFTTKNSRSTILSFCVTFSDHLPRTLLNLCPVSEVKLTLEGSCLAFALSELNALLFNIEISAPESNLKLTSFFTNNY